MSLVIVIRIFKVSLAAESRIIFLGSLVSPPNEHVDKAYMLMFFPNTLSACARELQSGGIHGDNG